MMCSIYYDMSHQKTLQPNNFRFNGIVVGRTIDETKWEE